MPLQKFRERQPRHNLHHQPEQHIARVAIAKFRPRREIHRVVPPQKLRHILVPDRFCAFRPRQFLVIPQPRRMRPAPAGLSPPARSRPNPGGTSPAARPTPSPRRSASIRTPIAVKALVSEASRKLVLTEHAAPSRRSARPHASARATAPSRTTSSAAPGVSPAKLSIIDARAICLAATSPRR